MANGNNSLKRTRPNTPSNTPFKKPPGLKPTRTKIKPKRRKPVGGMELVAPPATKATTPQRPFVGRKAFDPEYPNELPPPTPAAPGLKRPSWEEGEITPSVLKWMQKFEVPREPEPMPPSPTLRPSKPLMPMSDHEKLRQSRMRADRQRKALQDRLLAGRREPVKKR